jgi:molybdate transport system substrate-binding protein
MAVFPTDLGRGVRLCAFALVAAMSLMVRTTGADAAEAPVTVSAAVSLTDALEEIAREYRKSTAEAVRFNFGGSNALSRQIVSGAPVDLFISADDAQMDVAVQAGVIDARTRIPLLRNRLAIVTLPGGPGLTASAGLLQPIFRRIAIGDPAAVPAGVYARRYLERVGLWDRLSPKIVPVANVRAALAAVENGSADAAITYETDAATAKRARAAFVVAGDAAPLIVYPAAIVSRAPNRIGAERFLAYLRGAAASAIFARYKFAPIAPGS